MNEMIMEHGAIMKYASIMLDFYNKNPDYLCIFINALLVTFEIRKSFMIQPQDYKEILPNNIESISDLEKDAPITSKLIRNIHEIFPEPELKYVYIDQGILILRKETEITFDLEQYTQKELGELLSYPCAGDIFANRNFSVSYHILYNNRDYSLFTSICGKIVPEIEILYQKIRLLIEEINLYFNDNKMICEYRIVPIITIDTLINNIINDRIYQEQEDEEGKEEEKEETERLKYEVRNTFYNSFHIILNILEENSVFNIFDPKYKQFLLYLLVEEKSETECQILSLIEDKKKNKEVQKLLFKGKNDFTVNMLTTVYDVIIDQKYITEAYNVYF